MAKKAVIPEPKDRESDIDGCDVSVEKATSDEDLPATEGGVQKGRGKSMTKKAVFLKPKDSERDIDGCDVSVIKATSDEDLPATEGGVV